MTTIVTMFIFACFLGLIITPWVTRLGIRLKIVDQPEMRKIHHRPVPRIGGLAIYLAFYGTLLPMLFPSIAERALLLERLANEPRLIAVAVGSAVAFGLGLYDDNRGLGPWTKFGIQAVAALIAYWGGIQIQVIQLPKIGLIDFGWIGLPITVFWILLVINAVNLIDGLDGLAAGVSFFVCTILVVLCVIGRNYLVAAVLAALAGAILGFLRYNFNPATIFMGDGGSYFLGYMLATMSVIGSIKSHATVALLIPVIALGVPLIDTMWTTVRRFVVGKGIFQPDRHHLHHRLLAMGFNQRHAVLLLYGVSILMGAVALLLVNVRDERAGLILLVLAVLVILGIRRLGYLDYIRRDRFVAWLRDLHDETGLSHERRSFLYDQIQISEAHSLADLWERTTRALAKLEFDMAALYLNNGLAVHAIAATPAKRHLAQGQREASIVVGEPPGEFRTPALAPAPSPAAAGARAITSPADSERRRTPLLQASVCMRRSDPDFLWQNPSLRPDCRRFPMRIELELSAESQRNLGTLVLLKDVATSGLAHYTLKRVEHLRRNLTITLDKLSTHP